MEFPELSLKVGILTISVKTYGQVYAVARVCFFFQAKRRVGIKRRAMSFGIVVGMDENSMRFLADGDPTIGSGITGHQSSEFPKTTARSECTA